MKLADLLDQLGDRRNGQVKLFCPACHHTRRKHPHEKELSVNLDDGVYNCWHCSINGRLDDVTKSPFATKEKREYRIPDPEKLKAEPPDPQVVEYFAQRGISEQTLADWKISYGPSFPIYDYDAPRKNGTPPIKRDGDGFPIYLRGIQFHYLEDGKTVNLKYLRPKEWMEDGGDRQFRSFPGGKPVPYGLERAGGRIVIVEGEIDALSVYEAGIHEVWSLPYGAKNFDWMELGPVVDRLLATGDIYLAPDADAEGRACREEMVRRLSLLVGMEKISLVNWPDGCKDANDVLVKHGPERLKEIIEQESKPVPIDGISEVDEFVPEYLEFYDEGVPKGLSTCVAAQYDSDGNMVSPLDEIYRVMPGMVTVVTGVTNYGKSELMDEIVRCMIEEHHWKFAFYTPENFPLPLHLIKIAEKYIGKPFDRTKLGAMTRQEADDASNWMQGSFFYLNPRNTIYSVDEILERARVLVYRKGVQGLIIDPWNYVRKDFGGLREDQFINQELQKLCVFAKATGVHVWLTVHPRTLRKDPKTQQIDIPNVMDLSGGSKFGDNADFIFSVHRNPKEAYDTGIHKVQFNVQKSRYRYAARQGYVTLEWEPFNGRFKPAGVPSPSPRVVVPSGTIERQFGEGATLPGASVVAGGDDVLAF